MKRYATELRGNPSIDKKIKDGVVRVLLEKSLGYRTGYFGERKMVVDNAL